MDKPRKWVVNSCFLLAAPVMDEDIIGGDVFDNLVETPESRD